MASPIDRLVSWLEARRLNQAKGFKLFVMGGLTLLVGLGMVVLSEIYLPLSLKQELVAASGIIIGGFGALGAIAGYFILLTMRLRNFFNKR